MSLCENFISGIQFDSGIPELAIILTIFKDIKMAVFNGRYGSCNCKRNSLLPVFAHNTVKIMYASYNCKDLRDQKHMHMISYFGCVFSAFHEN